MKKNLAAILADKKLARFIWFNGFIFLIFAITFVWKWSALPPQLPLFYSLPRGPEQLGTPIQLLALPLFAIVFSILNVVVAAFLYTKEKLAATILIIISTVVSLLLFVTFMKIVFSVS